MGVIEDMVGAKMGGLEKMVKGGLEEFIIEKLKGELVWPILEDIECVKDTINRFSAQCSKNFKEINSVMGERLQYGEVLGDLRGDLKALKDFLEQKSRKDDDERNLLLNGWNCQGRGENLTGYDIFKTIKTISDNYHLNTIPNKENYLQCQNKSSELDINQNLINELDNQRDSIDKNNLASNGKSDNGILGY
jgi:hypothetical protein